MRPGDWFDKNLPKTLYYLPGFLCFFQISSVKVHIGAVVKLIAGLRGYFKTNLNVGIDSENRVEKRVAHAP